MTIRAGRVARKVLAKMLRGQARFGWWLNRRRLRQGRADAVFIGDSLTEFWLDENPWLFLGGIYDAGIRGETTGGMLARFDAQVVALRPRVVHIMGGTNDLWHGVPGEGASIAIANIEEMVARARTAGIAVVLASPPPISDEAAKLFGHPELYGALCAAIEAICARLSLVHVDYAKVLCGADGAPVAAYFTDGVHLTHTGYRAMRGPAVAALRAARHTTDQKAF